VKSKNSRNLGEESEVDQRGPTLAEKEPTVADRAHPSKGFCQLCPEEDGN
jgi:hypothetical protein